MMSFFFQAEDGIRDLVRSRGLGDVYKRQAEGGVASPEVIERDHRAEGLDPVDESPRGVQVVSVSYTHLTLPTSDLV